MAIGYNGYPTGEVLQELLDQTSRDLLERTGEHFGLTFDANESLLKAVRRRDGYHCAFEIRRGPMLTRQHGQCFGEIDALREKSDRTAMAMRLLDIVATIARTCRAEAAGINPNEAWRNDRGEPYATLPDCGVTVHRFDTVDSMTSHDWSFYVGDRRAYRASRRLLGEAPSVEILTAIWKAFQDGVSAGERAGFKDGEQAAKKHLREWLGDPPKRIGTLIQETITYADGTTRVRHGRA